MKDKTLTFTTKIKPPKAGMNLISRINFLNEKKKKKHKLKTLDNSFAGGSLNLNQRKNVSVAREVMRVSWMG